MSDLAITEELIEAAAERCRARKRAIEIKDARLRLTCAALTGLYACGDAGERVPLMAVGAADACLALLYPEVPHE